MSKRYRYPTSRFEVFSMRFEANNFSRDKEAMIEYLIRRAVPGDLGFVSDEEGYKKFIDIDKRFRVEIERDPANFKGRIFVFSCERFYEIYNSMNRDVVLYTDLSPSSNKRFVDSCSGHTEVAAGHTYLPVMGSHLGSGIIFDRNCNVIVHRDSGNSNIDDSYLDTVHGLYYKGFLPRFDDSKFHYDYSHYPNEPFKFTVPGFYHSLIVDGMVIRDSKSVRVEEVKWFMTGENHHPSNHTDIYICGELSVISEGRKSLLLKTPLNKAIRVSHGQPIPLLKSVVAVPYYQDFTFSATLGCPNNIDDSALYFPTVNASVTFFSDSDSDNDDDENEDEGDPGLDTLDEDDPDLGTLEEEEEVPVLDTHEGAASEPSKFYVFRKVIYGTGGFLEVNTTVDMQ